MCIHMHYSVGYLMILPHHYDYDVITIHFNYDLIIAIVTAVTIAIITTCTIAIAKHEAHTRYSDFQNETRGSN